MKPNKENIITDILIELEKGVERAECLATIVNKWQISVRTFDRHWKNGNERHKERQSDVQTALAGVSKDAAVERLKTAILKKDEALELLTKIANSSLNKPTDQISAIKTIADLEGWNEPIKTDSSNVIRVVRE